MPTDRRQADFAGRWWIARQITHADGQTATFSGEAVFSPNDAGELDYVEEGVLEMPGGHKMRATRRYLWTDGLVVFFDDGRPFHTVPVSGGSATHLCPPDTYDVTYEFGAWPNWRATWDVSGPKKSYRMTSEYSPLA